MWTGAWPSVHIFELSRSLESVAALVRSPQRDQSDEVRTALARFLVIRACGYLEQTTEESCKAFVASKSIPTVASYGASWLGRGASPKPEHLVTLVKQFDTSWSEELEAFLRNDDDLLWREVSFLVDRRNKMAHGASEGTGARKALDLTEHASRVAEWFLVKFDPR